jgi:replicative DNA helicase
MEDALWNEDAERALLGGVMALSYQDDTGRMAPVFALLDCDDFSGRHHREVWAAYAALWADKTPIDECTVRARLAAQGYASAVDGGPGPAIAYLAELTEACGVGTNVLYYARLLRDHALRRRAVAIAAELGADSQLATRAIAETLADSARRIADAEAARATNGAATARASVREWVAAMDGASERGTRLTYGWPAVDGLLSPMLPGQMIVVAARPGIGKTAWALCVARHLLEAGRRVLLVSLEMTRPQLVARLAAMVSGAPLGELVPGARIGTLSRAAMDAIETVAAWDWIACERAGMTIDDLTSEAMREHARKPIDLVIVDYLQLMSGGNGRRGENRQAEIAEISRGVKALAMAMRAPVMALSQLNRALEGRDNKRPQLSDLRESGAIEQDADAVVMLYREGEYQPDAGDAAEVIVRKQRDGATGTATLRWHGRCARFEDARG